MSTSLFRVTEHQIPCQHIREYPNGIKTDGILQLAVKEYQPLQNLCASPDSWTILATYATGVPKECYEPLWDELLQRTNVQIRAIWIADCSHQGASGVLNENIQGDDPNWFDHSRDLLCMVNHFRDRIRHPIMGVAHSFGCSQFVHLSTMHPRLFQALAFLEPMLQRENPTGIDGPMVARGTSRKPDLWKSRQDAEAALRKGTFLRPWDPKAVERYLQFGLREVPTAVYPLMSKVPVGSVTLTTTKAQEAWTLLRMNATMRNTNTLDNTDRYTSPDLTEEAGEDDCNNTNRLMNCPAPCMAFELLPYVRPPVLYVFGSKSHISRPERQEDKLERTGTGFGGSGGASKGMVKAKTITAASHMMPMEKPTETASILGQWMEDQKNEYKAEKDFRQNHDSGKSVRNQTTLSLQWMQIMDKPAGAPRSLKSSL